ncbi:MAG: transketolase [Chloroflexi bacterium]|nr:transketolase [Chloroflexota bacterium]
MTDPHPAQSRVGESNISGSTIDELCVNTIRCLAMDAVQKANSGHPGAPMGAAAMAYILWDRLLKHNPNDAGWLNRDRFVLSAGHASMLLYSLLYLTGYDLPFEELKRFRQWESMTPGHVERGPAPGVEVTTGPLGQGFGNAVGMAIAERWLADHYNRPGHEIIDHYTYVLASDGDLMEGVSSEAASLAGHLKLGKLIVLYDDNDISIEGSTDITFTEDVAMRFQAYGWHVVGPIDGLDMDAVDAAIQTAQKERNRPCLIICKTIIGYGSPNKANTGAAHGEPLGEEEVRLAKEKLGWPYPEPFTVPQEVLKHMRQAVHRGHEWQEEWKARLDEYRRAYPDEASRLEQDVWGELPPGWDEGLSDLFKNETKPIATRDASGKVMNAIAPRVHSLMGGAGDLSPSTKTILNGQGDFQSGSYCGHNMHFGVREHSMGAIANGMALHGGIIPYTATFLIFYDYMRPPVRLAALMGIRVIYIFTHDSIGLGEDGPTHQPIEHLAGLRAVPNLVTIRPADATETAEAWQVALERKQGPTALILTRQKLPVLDRSVLLPASGLRRGGYILWQAAEKPDIILIATGSEVHIALEAGKLLQKKGIFARVVSLPSWELFDSQPTEYRNEVLPPDIRMRVSVEAASLMGWERYIGLDGVAIGLKRFGASAPGEVVMEKLGFTAQRVANEASRLLQRRKE